MKCLINKAQFAKSLQNLFDQNINQFYVLDSNFRIMENFS